MKTFIKNARYFWAGGDNEVRENVSILVENSQILAVAAIPSWQKRPGCTQYRCIRADSNSWAGKKQITFYQTLTKNSQSPGCEAFYLLNLYPLWARII
jgi:hypothetical protein